MSLHDEYPKHITVDGVTVTVQNPDDEARWATAAPPVAPEPEPVAEPEPEPAADESDRDEAESDDAPKKSTRSKKR